ncbi:MAG: TRAM domain-containing protein [Spirochaetes bacterium]|nr:TRAM domain-containing protein [Spirochaetota bacterium]
MGAAFVAIARSFGIELPNFYRVIIYVCSLYIGIALISQLDIGFGLVKSSTSKAIPGESLKILDTSVIIDGRIADIIETKFIEGVLIVPKFVLDELQQIADSSDSVKRTRGRRGLDVLNRLKKDSGTLLRITDQDFPETFEVDSKLVKLGKALDAKIITNDFNLLKVAQIQGVTVLNINLLANSLKPIVLPGEKMKIVVIKEGKDPGQGIGYLDDGTMIVVDSGKKYVGDEIFVTVTSVLQTPAGRMIFAKYAHG